MAIRNVLAAGMPDLTSARPAKPDVTVAHGVLRTSCFVADILNADSIASTYVVARIPSHARMSRQSEMHNSIVASAAYTLGVAGAAACLMAATSLAAAGTVRGLPAIAVGDDAKPLWQLAGMLTDPKMELDVIVTLTAAATGTGKLTADLVYICD